MSSFDEEREISNNNRRIIFLIDRSGELQVTEKVRL